MKKLIYILSLLTISMYGCDPLDETYKELDSLVPDRTAAQVFEITLTDEDYEWLDETHGVAGFGNFESEDEAREFIPFVLDNLYPHLGDGSAITVYFNLYRGGTSEEAFFYSDVANDNAFTLESSDYAMASEAAGQNGFFNNDSRAEDYIPAVLTANYPDASEGDMMAVTYDYSPISYDDIEGIVIFEEDFATVADFDAYTAMSLTGAQVWDFYTSSSGYSAARMSGYSGGNVANKDVLIVTDIDLTNHNDAFLRLTQVLNFLGDAQIGTHIDVKVATDYNGTNYETANWVSLEFDQWPAGNNYDVVESNVSLADFGGETIQLAFYYESTTAFAPQWRVVNILVEEGESVETDTRNVFYAYEDNSWTAVDKDEVYYLSESDYDNMGSPGTFGNFSSSDLPADYIPQMLNMMFPYAQEGEQQIVVYKYFSSGSTQTRADIYTLSNNTWSGFQSEVEQQLQFANEDGVWVPDNTIRYTLAPGDYTKIGNNPELGTESGRSNLLSFGNLSTFAWSSEDILEAINYVLHENFPASEVGQKYLVTYNTYPAGDLQMHVILNEDGDYVPIE